MNMKRLYSGIAAVLLALALSAPAQAADVYALDPAHSSVGFAVKHMVIAKVRGVFEQYDASFTIDEGSRLTSATADIQAASINTRIEKRDNHLRSEDFFHASAYPLMTFRSETVTHKGGNAYEITGTLTIRGTAKTVTLTSEGYGPVKDPWGYQRIGFSAYATINRKDFGLNWNQVLEAGGLLVGDEVEITLEGEGVLQP
jgi:polyisoprenoid-binding protein YceI